jgi:hypothetical protein
MEFRKLSKEEITALTRQGCIAEDWNTVLVKEEFNPERIKNVTFSGHVSIGKVDGTLDMGNDIQKKTGIYNSSVHNCTIGDFCYISEVRNLVRYDIADHVGIENVSSITMTGESTFGNGVMIEVLNEGGGREKPLFDKLTSQLAYIIVTYRHDQKLIEKLYRMIDRYVMTRKSDRGTIGEGARIVATSSIKNSCIGEKTRIEGTLLLEEGTVASNKQDPVFIGEGVIAKQFVILSGSRIDGASVIEKCFIGQGVKIGKQFSCENSGFFANCEGFHGEALSIFAGPYTVTHHKSTLLIAALFSFYNAGSGSNQSNHMYKLGPNHQGILERGSKTGSFSYMMWPCRVGAFTGVIGKHYANFDSSDLPFSYILESNGKSVIIPAMNLCTVGTLRDSAKWPNRDRRKDTDKKDLLNFELFSPYTVGRMIRGVEHLKQFDENTPEGEPFVEYNGLYIKRNKLQFGYRNYEMAIRIYVGREIIKQLEKNRETESFDDLISKMYLRDPNALGRWVDLSGMLAPQNSVDELISEVYNDTIQTIDEFVSRLNQIHEAYEQYSWAWCIDLIQDRLGNLFGDITREQIIQIIGEWKNSALEFNQLVLQDAKKEFSEKSKIGYGIDGGLDEKNRDFEAVLGKYEENKFVKGLLEESKPIGEKAEELIDFIQNLK